MWICCCSAASPTCIRAQSVIDRSRSLGRRFWTPLHQRRIRKRWDFPSMRHFWVLSASPVMMELGLWAPAPSGLWFHVCSDSQWRQENVEKLWSLLLFPVKTLVVWLFYVIYSILVGFFWTAMIVSRSLNLSFLFCLQHISGLQSWAQWSLKQWLVFVSRLVTKLRLLLLMIRCITPPCPVWTEKTAFPVMKMEIFTVKVGGTSPSVPPIRQTRQVTDSWPQMFWTEAATKLTR